MYEPFVVIMSAPDLLKGGYIKHISKWMEYAGFHFPHKVRRLPPVGDRSPFEWYEGSGGQIIMDYGYYPGALLPVQQKNSTAV